MNRGFEIASICDVNIFRVMGMQKIESAKPAIQKVGASAIIPINGVIDRKYPWSGSTPESIAYNFMEALNDNEVSKIVLMIDSPGGLISGITKVANMIYQARSIKPIVAHVDGMAASAAYWLASQASKVYLEGNLDQVGSIGVVAMFYDFSKLYETEGVKPVLIDTGEFKSTGAEGMPITEAQIEDIRKTVNQVFAEFKSAIVRGRGMDASRLKEVADGRMFMGQSAIDAGLADGIQPLRETLNPPKVVPDAIAALRGKQLKAAAELAKHRAESLLIKSAESDGCSKVELKLQPKSNGGN